LLAGIVGVGVADAIPAEQVFRCGHRAVLAFGFVQVEKRDGGDRETAEFANVGVVLLCPEVDFFGSLFERHKYKRITDFFPELDSNIFKAGLAGFLKELGRVTSRDHQPAQFVLHDEVQSRIAAFKELVRPRESIFHFGEVATVLAADPRAKLEELFNFYIKRPFASDREYQEIIMRRSLADFLQKIQLAPFYKLDQRIGDDTYNVMAPFVHYEGNTPRKVIKPLQLAKPATTEIYRHGDAWISTVRRLDRIKCLPKEFLFTVKQPVANKQHEAAAQEICTELENYGAMTVRFADREAIERFARV